MRKNITTIIQPAKGGNSRSKRSPTPSADGQPWRRKIFSYLSKNALIITLIIIITAVGISGRDLITNTIGAISNRVPSPQVSADDSALYRDVFLPMSDMVIAGKDFEAFLIANNSISRADWYISFYNTMDQTFINIYPRKSLSRYDKPSVSVRVPVRATPYAFHAVTLSCGTDKTVSIERYPSGNIYYFAKDKEKPLSDRQALDDIVKSWH